jgi:3-oxoacyl-[acyl-carrier-protein] synthase II
MTERRVVITGMGALTPIGMSTPDFWQGLIQGKSGVREITHFDTTHYATKFAAQLDNYDPGKYLDHKEARRMDKFSQYALIASDEALVDSKIDLDTINKYNGAVLIGSGIGGMDTFYRQAIELYDRGPRAVSPFFIPMLIPDIASGQVSIKYGFRGANFCAVSACATGSHNIGLAYDSIRRGESEYALCGGAESPVIEVGIAGFNALKAMSTRNDDPSRASRPFDKTRDGFVLGEGAGILFLESLDTAKARGARIYAEIVGYGFSADAYHITAPDPDGNGVQLAMRKALAAAQISPEQVQHLNMHGPSTPLGDIAETTSIKKVFGRYAQDINLNSTKSMTGHMLGAAGAAESIATILAIYHGVVPPTINFSEPDPECDLNYTFNKAQPRQIEYAINNAFGFGGHNTSVVFRKFLD